MVTSVLIIPAFLRVLTATYHNYKYRAGFSKVSIEAFEKVRISKHFGDQELFL
jgi:hypothetical protein